MELPDPGNVLTQQRDDSENAPAATVQTDLSTKSVRPPVNQFSLGNGVTLSTLMLALTFGGLVFWPLSRVLALVRRADSKWLLRLFVTQLTFSLGLVAINMGVGEKDALDAPS